MIVLQKGKMRDGTIIQIEDWSQDYKFVEYASTIAAYPISKTEYNGQFSPKKGRKTRMQYNFKSNREAKKVFNELVEGTKTLKDIEDKIYDRRYKDCV